ncbi:hypothetical protein [Halovenus sp. HT40]|uniref:hypothetical protein n=1 Tax=Halovenus sp. HT40 TaxID=3126691 RepID=UPI00300EF451
MLGLRYFSCERCGTVYALPETPSQCGRCECDRLSELTAEGRAAAYFAPVDDQSP